MAPFLFPQLGRGFAFKEGEAHLLSLSEGGREGAQEREPYRESERERAREGEREGRRDGRRGVLHGQERCQCGSFALFCYFHLADLLRQCHVVVLVFGSRCSNGVCYEDLETSWSGFRRKQVISDCNANEIAIHIEAWCFMCPIKVHRKQCY